MRSVVPKKFLDKLFMYMYSTCCSFIWPFLSTFLGPWRPFLSLSYILAFKSSKFDSEYMSKLSLHTTTEKNFLLQNRKIRKFQQYFKLLILWTKLVTQCHLNAFFPHEKYLWIITCCLLSINKDKFNIRVQVLTLSFPTNTLVKRVLKY